MKRDVGLLFVLVMFSACAAGGATLDAATDPNLSRDAGPRDATVDASRDAQTDSVVSDARVCQPMEICGNAIDDDCDTMTDEGCDIVCPQGLLCADYESAVVPGTDQCGDGAVGFTSAAPAFGNRSISFDPPDGPAAGCSTAIPFNGASDLWVRTWLRYTGSFDTANVFYVRVAQGSGRIGLVLDRATNSLSGRAYDTTQYGTGPLPASNTWQCVEVHARLSGGVATYEAYVAGNMTNTITAPGVAAETEMNAIVLGGHVTNGMGFRLDLDNTVVSAVRVPCL